MKTRDQSQSIICDFHGRKIELFNGEKWKKHTVKRIIPMRLHREGKWQKVGDVEILLNKEKNFYFSIKMFLTGKSWAKEIRVGGINLSVKGNMTIITNVERFVDEDWEDTANFILELKNHSTQETGVKNA